MNRFENSSTGNPNIMVNRSNCYVINELKSFCRYSHVNHSENNHFPAHIYGGACTTTIIPGSGIYMPVKRETVFIELWIKSLNYTNVLYCSMRLPQKTC